MNIKISLLVFFLFSMTCIAATPQTHQVNSVTGAETWKTQSHGVHFSLTQILPEQLQAFYVNRGFSLQQIEPYISSCVYMAVVRNDKAPGTIHFISNDWQVFVDGKAHPLVSVESWMQRWKNNNIKQSAQIAFRWAQFPPEQKYDPGGDWNQGMLSIGLPTGTRFDVIARWNIGSKAYETKLQGVQCAQ